MSTTVLFSTFCLTLLLAIGLLFFIRASVKERIQQVQLMSEQTDDSLLAQLQQYFTARAYRVTSIDANQNQVTFEGFVRPSLFLSVFLSLLAACGLLCFALVLSILFHQVGNLFLGLVLLAPLAGVFYWQRAGRPEQVLLKVETLVDPPAKPRSLLTVTAHRDELATLQAQLNLKPCD